MKMTDDALKALVASRKNAAVGYLTTAFTQDRIEALKFYRGDLLGDEEEGLSQVVSRDVYETIESLMPPLMRPFISGDEVVRFEATIGNDDQEDTAKQATDYINYLFMKRNDSFAFIYDTMKDGLMMRLGVAKVVREETTESANETYTGLHEIEMQALKMDDAVKIVSKKPSQLPSVDGSQLFDVKAIRNTDKAQVRTYPVPPDEFLFERQLARLDDATFLAHRTRKTISELIDMGFDRDKCMALPDGDVQDYTQERLIRFDDEQIGDNGNTEKATRLVWITEAWIKCQYDGANVSWRRVVIAGSGDEILLNEEADDHPFACWTPIPIPHKLVGLSYADVSMDIQLIKTALWRESLNNAYLTNRPMREVVETSVNIDDLLNPRIGGIVRVKAPGMIREMVTPFTAGDSFQLIEYADTTREQRTGVTRYNQGMDANTLNKTATGITAIMSAAQQRQELTARHYAEFMKRVFRKMLELVCKYPDDAEIQRLAQHPTKPMDPREWSTEYDMTVSVGLGTGDRQAEVQHYQQLLQMDQTIIQLQQGVNGPLIKLPNIYEKYKHLMQAMGIKGIDRYITDPSAPPDPNEPQQPQQPDPHAMAAQQAQAAQQSEQAAAMQQHQVAMQTQAAIAQHKTETEAQTHITVAQIKAQADLQIAQIKAATDARVQEHRTRQGHETAVTTGLMGHVAEALKPEPPVAASGSPSGSDGANDGHNIQTDASKAVEKVLANRIANAALGPAVQPPLGHDYVDDPNMRT